MTLGFVDFETLRPEESQFHGRSSFEIVSPKQ